VAARAYDENCCSSNGSATLRAPPSTLPFQLNRHQYRLSIGLESLLGVHFGDFVARVNPLAEPPPFLGLAWAYWATSARVSLMAHVAIRHLA
jgi:hypothetical protein